MKNKKALGSIFAVFAAVFVIFAGVSMGTSSFENDNTTNSVDIEDNNYYVSQTVGENYSVSLKDIPPFSGEPYYVINRNIPEFETGNEITKPYFENYSPLDNLGRCGVALACLGRETMPTEERGEIGQVKPSGWITAKYDCVDGKYLYNRCHLIGFQLSGENANERNLITGTRYMNVQGMLPFENMVADYIKETGNHVLYRVTPVFEGYELVAKGVQMEAYSVEDKGEGVCFNVFCYNSQPGVSIDYTTGDSWLEENAPPPNEKRNETYILNISSKKFHRTTCYSVNSMNEENKKEYTGSREDIINDGYSPCGSCKP